MENISKGAFYRFLFNPARKYLYLVCGLFLISFLVTKLSYFYYYPVWRTTVDIYTYSDPIIALKNHQWPVFDLRTPAYPLFLAVTYFAGIGLNGVLFIQMLCSLIACVISLYLIFNYKRLFFIPFSVILLLFYSSGEFTAINTLVHPASLFSDAILLFSVFLVAGIESQKSKHLVLASIFFTITIFLRPQGLFIMGIGVGGAIVYFINNRNLKLLLPLFAPAAFSFILLFSYNYFTFNLFGFSKFSTLSKLGYVIYFIEESPDYPLAMNQSIKDVREAIGQHTINLICNKETSLSTLDTIFTNTNYDYCWRFMPFIKSDNALVEKLVTRATVAGRQNVAREFYTCFSRFNSLDCQPVYFYFNELRNRVNYIESGKDFYLLESEKGFYPLIWREWETQMVSHKLPDYPILKTQTEFTSLFRKEPYMVRALSYFELAYNGVFSKKIWILLYYFSLLISLLLLLVNLVRSVKIEPVLLMPFLPLLNSILVSLIIPPLSFYVFPTKFFFIVSPFLVFFYLLHLYGKRRA